MKKYNLGLWALGSLAVGTIRAEQAPNVIIIYGDDIGYGDFSCNGSMTIHTPNVDAVASSGVRFTNAHATAATSTPSRYSLLTGEYAWRRPGTGIAAGDAAMIIKPEQYTMADVFKDAGYATGAIGKWHLGLGDEAGKQDWNGEVAPNPADLGFEYSYIMAATADRVPCVYIENGKVVGLDPNDPIEVSYSQNFPGEPTGKDNPELLRVKYSHGHDNTIVNGISRIGYMKGGHAARWVDANIADTITAQAIQFIERNKEKPFFLYLGTNDIHVPRDPHPRFAGKSGMGPRGDVILAFDWTVGEIVRTLKENGLYENTLLIISSDNGPVVDDGYQDQAVELLGDHKPGWIYRGGKYSAFEAGTRVPCMLSWPAKVREPLISGALMSQVDLFATFGALVGAEIPEGAAKDSRAELDAWLGNDLVGREFVVEQNADNTLSLLMGDWKYIVPSSSGSMNTQKNIETGNSKEHQLYNLKDDPGETTNLASQYPDIVEQFRQKLKSIRLEDYQIENLEIVNVENGWASSFNGEGTHINKSFDDDFNSYYHSKWSNEANAQPGYFPITLNYNFGTTDIESIVYHTRTDGNTNGNFKKFELWALPDRKTQYVKIGEYDFEGRAGSFVIDMNEEQKGKMKNIRGVQFVVHSGAGPRVGYASCAEMIFYSKKDNSTSFGAFKEADQIPIVIRDRKIELRNPTSDILVDVYSISGQRFGLNTVLAPDIYIVKAGEQVIKLCIM